MCHPRPQERRVKEWYSSAPKPFFFFPRACKVSTQLGSNSVGPPPMGLDALDPPHRDQQSLAHATAADQPVLLAVDDGQHARKPIGEQGRVVRPRAKRRQVVFVQPRRRDVVDEMVADAQQLLGRQTRPWCSTECGCQGTSSGTSTTGTSGLRGFDGLLLGDRDVVAALGAGDDVLVAVAPAVDFELGRAHGPDVAAAVRIDVHVFDAQQGPVLHERHDAQVALRLAGAVGQHHAKVAAALPRPPDHQPVARLEDEERRGHGRERGGADEDGRLQAVVAVAVAVVEGGRQGSLGDGVGADDVEDLGDAPVAARPVWGRRQQGAAGQLERAAARRTLVRVVEQALQALATEGVSAVRGDGVQEQAKADLAFQLGAGLIADLPEQSVVAVAVGGRAIGKVLAILELAGARQTVHEPEAAARLFWLWLWLWLVWWERRLRPAQWWRLQLPLLQHRVPQLPLLLPSQQPTLKDGKDLGQGDIEAAVGDRMLAAAVELEGTPKALQAPGHVAWERDSAARVGLWQAGPAQGVAAGQHDGAA